MATHLISLIVAGSAFCFSPDSGLTPQDSARQEQVQSNKDVLVLSEDLVDSKRSRTVPIRIYAPATGDNLPIIIFSHGLGGSREGYGYLGKHWAASGFVVVHPEHEGSDRDLLQRGAGAGNLKKLEQAAADPRNAVARADDVHFVITHMIEKVQSGAADSTKVLKGRLNTAKIGMAGHSFGANTTMMVSGLQSGIRLQAGETRRDPRIVAAIAMSTPVNQIRPEILDRMYEEVRIPVLHMTGTKDSSPFDLHGPEVRRLPFDHSRNSDRTLILFKDGDHAVFAASPGDEDSQRRLLGRLRATSNYGPIQAVVLESSTHFWNCWLKGDAGSADWLSQKLRSRVGSLGEVEHRAAGQ